ncbi:MAG: UDP-N-acetylglucosamine--N-acetylmuramyl-(pentapeptide) pyrophosphoryl-undecaprenol N-acetylglucosamine transferase [Planctomycetota bacterium]|nr:MAG: UDP-N-acetylglucosamine--N-acetylmuramyl-(pentapeptide) pyrophosphoryl-undecaprenol N-acetylglucosamine transferase [Planctomycetota bacterium]
MSKLSRRPIFFASGGSGGHLFPAIAVADELRFRATDRPIMIVASEKSVDRSILATTSYSSLHLPVVSPSQILRHPVSIIRDSWRAYRTARQLIHTHAPAVVIGCGGFASAPLVTAAIRAGVPVCLLEQNVIPGRATVWFSRWATKVCLSFEQTRSWLPVSVQRRGESATPVTGTPVRAEFLSAALDRPTTACPPLLVILGGSQGSTHLNESFLAWAMQRPPELTGWRVVHQTGAGDDVSITARTAPLREFIDYQAISFLPAPATLYREAALIIGRAGATSLAELACLGKPVVLLPLPTAARDHQTANARWYAERGAAQIVAQGPTPTDTAHEWQRVLPPLLTDVAQRVELGRAMQATALPEAVQRIADLIEELAAGAI